MSLRSRATAILALSVAVLGVQSAVLPGAEANPAGTGLVISEAYGGGGNSGATLKSDFIELFNPTGADISVDDMSVQYRSASGTGDTQVTPLFGTVPAGGYYLVKEATGSGGSTDLTGIDATGTIAMSGTAFTVLLADQPDAVDLGIGSILTDPAVLDLVGANSNTFETATAPAVANATSAQRTVASTAGDTNNNAADVTVATPTPTGSGITQTPPPAAVCPTAPQTIAQIQGDSTDTSPCAGAAVTTTGVVTASYPTGGLNGFTLQTGGADTTPDASDGIFVFAGGATPALTAYPTIGSTVTVSGTAVEYFGLTQVSDVTSVAVAAAAQPAVVPLTVIPGTDCVQGSCPTTSQLNALKEKHESELYRPTAAYTVTDAYDGSPAPSTSSSFFGEIGLAGGSSVPLVAPTELYDSQNQASEITARTRYNNARRVILDDGSSTNYSTTTGSPLPWFTATHTVRTGAAVTFPAPVVLTYGNGSWKIEPQSQVVGKPTGKVTFSQTRPVAPGNVGGDLKLATFNVLNYFTTLGVDVKNADGTAACTAYADRAGNPVTVDSCPGKGPRGAWDAASLKRQQDKIVNAINTMDSDIVSLEEIENSLTTGGAGANRDKALATLVGALNADAGFTRWAFAPSPVSVPSDEDVIRTAFIYDPSTVSRVGAAQILIDSTAFDNAREPLAQAFKAKSAPDADAFAVVVNHFKSKGSGGTGSNADTGQGFYNGDRVLQANALATFADSFAAGRGIDRIFLTGDFNSYTQEDPVQALVTAGYTNLESTTTPGEKSYNFGGLDGSLDHVFVRSRSSAPTPVTGVDIWNINANESVYDEYSRFNSFVTNLYDASPYRASDHNPEIVGIDLPTAPSTEKIQVLATNDFHGRIAKDPASSAAGAGVLAGAVKQLRAANPETVFAAAGDLIGASTFESFIAQDKPTIDALNSAGLDVSSVGNHEFDQGYDDLVDRVMAPASQANPQGGAAWQYIGANIRKKVDNTHALAPRWTETFGDVKVGFVGAVTEHLPELVSPGGIQDITVTDIVTEANQQADLLKRNGADIVILLVHEGASSTAYADAVDPASDFGSIVDGVNDEFDAIVSGHTHLAYNHAVPVPGWIDEGRQVTTRPVVSAGQYGSNLNQLVFSYDDTSGEVVGVRQKILNLKTPTVDGTTTTYTENYPTDAATQSIVDTAVAQADVLGAQPLGQISGTFSRAKLADGTTENRGGESTLGNLVAEIQRWATRNPESGSAQIAFMNPGGLRADLAGTGSTSPRTVTYKQAATVQPFANTLVNEDLTGAQIKTVLEQQWQPAGASRPFLKLGISKGFSYTYDPSAPQGSRIAAIFLDGLPISPTQTYSVTVNSFLSTGGDNFLELANGTGKQDTGKTDLEAQVDYFAAYAAQSPLAVDSSQRGVGVTFPAGAPASYAAGSPVAFDLSSLSMTGPVDVADTSVDITLGDTVLGTVPVTTTRQAALPGFDEVGTAAVSVTLPPGTPPGTALLTVTGAQTGTLVSVPVTVAGGTASPAPAAGTTGTAGGTAGSAVAGTVMASSLFAVRVSPKSAVRAGSGRARLIFTVLTSSGAPATGTVLVNVKGQGKTRVTLVDGKGKIRLDAFEGPGKKKAVLRYLGAGSVAPSATTVTVKVVRR